MPCALSTSTYAPAELPQINEPSPYTIWPGYPYVSDRSLYSPTHKAYVDIRRVGQRNFDQEMELIRYLINYTPFNIVSIDTEFPGVIVSSNKHEDRNPVSEYNLMRINVNNMNLIQVGLTLSSYTGDVLVLGPEKRIVVWEFAISDFDIDTQFGDKRSIQLLKSRGLDFKFHRREGINSRTLVDKMIEIGLLMGPNNVSWITFHGAYDFAFLIKAVTGEGIPKTLEEFKDLVRYYFGGEVYDVKYMLKFYPFLFGGLERIASKLGVTKVPALGYQSGADSLLTQMVFEKMKQEYFKDKELLKKVPGHIHPLA